MVGGLFIFSGAIKVNDPIGTAIKLEEYFEVFAYDIAPFFEIFVPAAASRLVSRSQAESMIDNGLEVVSCGANVPFKDEEIFYGPIAEYVDENASLLPDFIANCGMARTFAYLMDPKNDRKLTDDDIFSDISQTIRGALAQVHSINSKKVKIADSAFEIALRQLI